MVYISSQNFTTSLRLSVQQTESSLSVAQKEVSSGVYADLGLQLGGGASTAISFAQQSSTLTSFLGSNASAKTRLSATSTALDSVLSGAQSVSTLLISNASTGAATGTLETQAQASLKALIGTLNTSVAGQYIFAGINTAQAPVADLATNQSTVDAAITGDLANQQLFPGASDPSQITAAQITAYLGNPNTQLGQLYSTTAPTALSSASSTQLTSQISPSVSAQTSVSAKDESLQDISQAYSLLTAFSGKGLSADASKAVTTAATALLNKGIAGLTTLQANIGVTQNSISDASDQITAQQTILTNNVNDLESVDTYTLSTRINALQTQLQDSYSLTDQLKSLSLVNYLAAQ